jgi:hypothetical protein
LSAEEFKRWHESNAPDYEPTPDEDIIAAIEKAKTAVVKEDPDAKLSAAEYKVKHSLTGGMTTLYELELARKKIEAEPTSEEIGKALNRKPAEEFVTI